MSGNASAAGGGSAGSGALLGVDSADVNGLLHKIQSRKWVATMRPVPVFAGANTFSKPRTSQEAMQRLEGNLQYFTTNYVALCLIVTVITVLMQPSLIIVGVVIAAMWYFASRQDEVRVSTVVLAGRNKLIALSSVTALLVFIFAGSSIFLVIGICATLVLLHAVLHTLPPLIGEGEDEQGGAFGADSEFLASPA